MTKIYKNVRGTPYKTQFPDGTTETSDLHLYLGLLASLKDRKGRVKTRKYDKDKNMIEEQYYYKSDSSYDYYKTTKLTYDYWGNIKTTQNFNRRILKTNSASISDTSLNDKIEYIYNNQFKITQVAGPNARNVVYDYEKRRDGSSA